MAASIYPITSAFVAEVGDVDLSRPLDREDLDEIKAAFWKYAVLIFPDQRLSVEQHLDFARYFGPHETTVAQFRPGLQLRVSPMIADVSNLTHQDEIWSRDSSQRLHEMGNRLWHTDSSFKRIPALASFLYARSIPAVGGHTEFADERAAYDDLSLATKQSLVGTVAEHCIRYSRARIGFADFSDEELRSMPPVPQAVVRTIPETGRKTLYLAAHAGRILGMPDHEGLATIDRLIAHATQRQFVYTHRWRVNDLVMWDDRCTMHRGTEFDDLRWRRDVQRATVSDIGPTIEPDSE